MKKGKFSVVALTSGGLDSSVVAVMLAKQGASLLPLFIDYGQRSAAREWKACKSLLTERRLGAPIRIDVTKFGKGIQSGLTQKKLDISKDAFFPGRNLYFLMFAATYAIQYRADAISIGLLSDKSSIFPDQTSTFLQGAQNMLDTTMGRHIQIMAPLKALNKGEVIRLASSMKLRGTYSCHMGAAKPCGKCIACLEFIQS